MIFFREAIGFYLLSFESNRSLTTKQKRNTKYGIRNAIFNLNFHCVDKFRDFDILHIHM